MGGSTKASWVELPVLTEFFLLVSPGHLVAPTYYDQQDFFDYFVVLSNMSGVCFHLFDPGEK